MTKEPIDYRIAVHYLPMGAENHNVRCLNGSAHIRRTSNIKDVTCDLCLNPNTNKEFWDDKSKEYNDRLSGKYPNLFGNPVIKPENEKEFVCRRCSTFLNASDMSDGKCPNCDTDENVFMNDLKEGK